MTGNCRSVWLKLISNIPCKKQRGRRVRQGISLLLVLALLFGAMPVTEAGAAHTHTDDCYDGTKHVHSEANGCHSWGFIDDKTTCYLCGGAKTFICTKCDGYGWIASGCNGVYEYSRSEAGGWESFTYADAGGQLWQTSIPVANIYVKCTGCGQEVLARKVGSHSAAPQQIVYTQHRAQEGVVHSSIGDYCGGTGPARAPYANAHKVNCSVCNGVGFMRRVCTTCDGTTKVKVNTGTTCDGTIYSGTQSGGNYSTTMYYCNKCNRQWGSETDSSYGRYEYGPAAKRVYGAVCGYNPAATEDCTECTSGYQYGKYACGKTEEDYYDENGNVCEPLCSKVVVALVPEKKTQSISAGQSINVNATATFLDGTSKKVSCSYSGFDSTKYNEVQTVTLSYGEYVGNAKTPGAKTATITVTIQGYFTVTVTSNDVSKGTVGGGGEKLAGSSVKVSAVPKGRNHFTGWYENGVCVSTLQEYTFTMPARHVSLTGRFQAIPVSLEVTPSSYTVYNGSEPEYTVKVKYSDNTTKTLNYDEYGKSGFTKGAGIKVVRFTYTEGSITVEAVITITVLRNTAVCRYGHEYELSDYDIDYGCPVCAEILVRIDVSPTEQSIEPGINPVFVVTGIYQDGHSAPVLSGYTTDFEAGKAGTQYVTVTYRELSKVVVVHVVKTFTCSVCYTKYPANADLSDPGCPECKRTCVHLSVSPTSQIVEQGLPMDITVTATFRDGHTETVADWTSNYQPYVIGRQQVTVLYGGQGAITEVIVVAKKAVCINCGTEYDPSVGGCPMCGHILKGIRATTKDGTNTAIKGNKPDWKVYGIYLDGHETPVEGGYTVTGLDVYTTGSQTVTIKYQGFSCVVVVEVVEGVGKTVCVNGHVYSLNQDGSDPGCPFCTVDADDKLEDYYTLSYGQDFLEQLYRDKVYYLKKGDSVTITVTKKKETGLTGWLKWLFGSFGKDDRMSFGGIVGN